MKKYRIEFKSGRAFEGTPKEIVTKMRDSSFTEYNKPIRLYMLSTSRRHRIVTGKGFNCTSYDTYVRSLADAEFTAKINEIS